MTTILAVETDQGVTMAADSQVTDNSGHIFETTKIVANGKFLVSGAGDCFLLDILKYTWKPPTPTQNDRKDLFRFMAVKVATSIRAVIESVYDKDKTDKTTVFDGVFAICGELFIVSDDFSVTKPRYKVAAAGSGGGYALGAYRAGATMQRALEIANDADANTSPPFFELVNPLGSRHNSLGAKENTTTSRFCL